MPKRASGYRTSATLEPFTLEAAYADRQKIVVVPDEVAEAERRARKELTTVPNKQVAWEDVATRAAELVVVTSAVLVAMEAIKAVQKMREKGLDVWLVGRGELEPVLMPPGHPLDDIVYIGHPAEPGLYYPTAEFHRRVFEHKFCEAVDLLMALGASSVAVERQEGLTREEAGDINVPLSPIDSIGARLKRRATKSSEAMFEGTFKGSTDPQVPEHLVWLRSERSWQTLIRARQEHAASKFGLVFRYESDYGVNAELKAKIEGVGLSLGGRFAEQRNTVWRLDAEFPQAP